MNAVIILAGGTGTRVGAGRPKQFIEVLGKPVLAYTCGIFQENARIDAIEVVCHHDWIEYCQEMVEQYNLTKVKWIVPGGDTFQDSVMNGMKHLENLLGTETNLDDNVFIQYGGAPFTSQKIVDAVIDMTIERGSAVTATPCYQLLSIKDDNDDTRTSTWVDRDKYTQIACPYGFKFSYLLDVYKRSAEQGLLEKIEPHTTSLMFALGETINLAYGDQTNIKITTAEDIDMFEGYVLMQQRKAAK
jgi:2-C-methyl-D-erythritol 4-phosphate cytidylyltransferase